MNVTTVLERGRMRCNTQKAQGRESAISLPVSNECSPKLLQAISDYSLHASDCWRRLSTITIMFFEWCVRHGRVPPLDGKYYWSANEQQYKWTKAKSRNQTLFRNMMVLRTYSNKPAGNQSNRGILNSFREDFGQSHAPPAQRRMHQDTSLRESVADKHRDNAIKRLLQPTGALSFRAWEILRMNERAGRAAQEESKRDC